MILEFQIKMPSWESKFDIPQGQSRVGFLYNLPSLQRLYRGPDFQTPCRPTPTPTELGRAPLGGIVRATLQTSSINNANPTAFHRQSYRGHRAWEHLMGARQL
jgi:hypothetical protein